MTPKRQTLFRGLTWVEEGRLLRTGLELREEGLGYPQIATVLALYENVDLSAAQVRAWLLENGARRCRPRGSVRKAA